MVEHPSALSIGAFAQRAGVTVETVRFYQRQGLLPQPARPHGGIRRYGEGDVARVRFIKTAQRLGFSLEEITELLRLQDGTQCEEASALAERKLRDVRRRLQELGRIESALAVMVQACHARTGTVSCPLIASLQSAASDPEHQGL